MIFSSMVFLWIFLPVSIIGYYVINDKLKNVFLLGVSLLFYAWGEPVYIVLILFSILANYLIGLGIDSCKRRKIWLIFGILFNLSILGYFKYFTFAVSVIGRLSGAEIAVGNIVLPVGISFFSFKTISYLIDVYKGEIKAEKNIFNVALYISFFPQLLAGPITKYRDVGLQIRGRKETPEKMAEGIRRFSYGLGKKVIISSILGEVVDTIIGMDINNVTFTLSWVVAIFYTLQIYYDFSGYSDMAIGLGKIFGFETAENFNYPYLAESVGDFWRRWHISLGAWFREYVYFPLGGNRKGTKKTYLNLMIVFLLTGLWHGASWNFIFWGLYHGFFQVIERLGLSKILKKSKILAHIYTISVFSFGWVFFRIGGFRVSLQYIARMLQPWKYKMSSYSVFEIVNHRAWFIVAIAIIGCGLIQTVIKNKVKRVYNLRGGRLELLYCASIIIISFSLLAGNTYNPFIYFKF